jgi:phosphate transport system protein
MERVGGIAVDICEIILRQIEAEYIKKPIHIPEMAQATIKMVKDSINAFVARDLALAQSVIEYDDIVDELFNTVKEELLSLIREKADNGEQAVDLLMIAKYFERVGDHAVSVSGWVVFSITSQYKNKRLF